MKKGDLMDVLRRFAQDRDAAFTDFVLNDNWDAILKYMHKYDMPVPPGTHLNAQKAGVYKAVQDITSLSQEVKEEAARKCIELGFKPYNDLIDGGKRMTCPVCGEKTKCDVMDSRRYPTYIRRRRKCQACGAKWTTYEEVDDRSITTKQEANHGED